MLTLLLVKKTFIRTINSTSANVNTSTGEKQPLLGQ